MLDERIPDNSVWIPAGREETANLGESFGAIEIYAEHLLTILWIVVKIMAIALPLILTVAYLTYAERKIIGYMQGRLGPNRVGPGGWLQPIADVIKMFEKEIIVPTASNGYLFILAPILTIAPALAAWAVIPFDQGLMLANINAGVLYLFAIASLGVYGVLIAGWASNSKYAFFGAMRSAAQTISYEIAMAPRRRGSAADAPGMPSGRKSGSSRFMDTLNERWDQRQDGGRD